MERLKVLNRQEIEKALQEGKFLRYATIYGKVYIQDKNWKILGAVRFETFLKLKGLKKVKTSSVIDEVYEREVK